MSLPIGTVTLLFTDIEKSTRLLDRDVAAMRRILIRHHDLVREAVERHNGVVFETVGDAVYAAFAKASDAVAAALAAQRALLAEPNPADRLMARMAIHSGEIELRDAQHYVGEPLVRNARLLVLGHGGQTLVTGSTAALVGSHMPSGSALRDLGSHRLRDLERREQVFQLEHPQLPTTFPPLISLESWPNNLPLQLTRFIGREAELARLAPKLEEARLLTLTGAGGSGKTRLAIELATAHGRSATHGAWFVDLAPLTDAPYLVPALSRVLALDAQLGTKATDENAALAMIVDYLRPKRTLIVLDNCEHLLRATANIATHLLSTCPSLRILATSREPLGAPGEQIYRVPGLDKAAELFVDRARSVEPEFSDDAKLVERVCNRLDRMPLAIELAAARVRALSVRDLASRLDQRLAILAESTRTANPRQQTLRATIDWSHALLDDAERAVLRRCSVFSGAFRLEAAEDICADPTLRGTVLDLVTSLVDKSLLTAWSTRDATRYRMLETIREYAAERLAENNEDLALRRRHAEHFLRFAETRRASLLGGADQQRALEHLDEESDNLLAALRWTTKHDIGLAARLGVALSSYLYSRGHTSDAATWAASMVDDVASIDASLHGEVLRTTAIIASTQREYDRAADLGERALQWFRERNDERGISHVFRQLAYVAEHTGRTDLRATRLRDALAHAIASGDPDAIAYAKSDVARLDWQQGNYADARRGYEEAITTRRELGDRWRIAPLLQDLAYITADMGSPERGVQLALECVALNRELRNRRTLAVALNTLGNILRQLGRLEDAIAPHEEAHDIATSLGDVPLIGHTNLALGEIALGRGDIGQASRLAHEALKLIVSLSTYRGLEWCLDLHARIALRQGEPARATQLMAAAIKARKVQSLYAPPAVVRQSDVAIDEMKSNLGDERFAQLWSRGAAMSRAEAVRFAVPLSSAPIAPEKIR